MIKKLFLIGGVVLSAAGLLGMKRERKEGLGLRDFAFKEKVPTVFFLRHLGLSHH